MIDFFTIGFIHLLGVISPGPDFAMVVKNAVCNTREVAVYTALGITLGVIFHLSYCILGLAVVISKSLFLFNLVKLLGAGYLIYVGIKALLPNDRPTALQQPKQNRRLLSKWRAFRQGLLCNLLNPKATLFFLGLFTLVVKPQTPLLIQIAYGAEMLTITLLWFTALAILITHPQVKQRIIPIQYYITKFMGVILLGFGVKLALMTHVLLS